MLLFRELRVLREKVWMFLVKITLDGHSLRDMVINLHHRDSLDFVDVEISPLRKRIIAVETLEAESLSVLTYFSDE